MNYTRIYNNIITRAKNRNLTSYTEKHHIIPKCMGGSNRHENLVKLTAKEHFIVHKLLVMIYPNNSKLIYALWAMSALKDNQYRKGKRHIISSRDYENIKILMSEITKKRLKEENVWINKKHKESSKEKMRKSAKNRSIAPEIERIRREKIKKAQLEIKRTKEWNKNISESKKGTKNPMYGKTGKNHHRSKIIIQYSKDDKLIREWDNARIAAEKLNLNYKGIMSCASGRNSTSGGFKWKYKKI